MCKQNDAKYPAKFVIHSMISKQQIELCALFCGDTWLSFYYSWRCQCVCVWAWHLIAHSSDAIILYYDNKTLCHKINLRVMLNMAFLMKNRSLSQLVFFFLQIVLLIHNAHSLSCLLQTRSLTKKLLNFPDTAECRNRVTQSNLCDSFFAHYVSLYWTKNDEISGAYANRVSSTERKINQFLFARCLITISHILLLYAGRS